MPLESPLVLGLVVVVGEQPRGVGDRVAFSRKDVDEHRVRDAHARLERLGLGDDEPLERLLGPVDEAVRRLLALDLLLLLGVVARLLDGAEVVDDVLGCLGDDPPARVEAGAARSSDDLVELTRLGVRCFVPSNFVRPVSRTVRIGTLMPTPRVSVPQMTLSRPSCASCSTRRRYFGSIPAWCTPMPCRTSRESVRPKPAPKRKLPMRAAIASRSSRGRDLDGHEALGPLEGGRLREVDDVDGRAVLRRAAPRWSRGGASRHTRTRGGRGARSR